MASSGMLRRVALVRTDVSEDRIASVIRVIWCFFVACRLLVTASVVPSSPILVTLMKEALSSSETSVNLHSHRRENLTSFTPYRLEGTGCVGRPDIRWLDSVEEFKMMGIGNRGRG
jgi:hypothetical protein